MARRPQGVQYWKGGSTAVAISGKPGNLYSVNFSWRALTAGQRILFFDGSDATGSVILEVVVSTANVDNSSVELPAVGLNYKTGLYYQPPTDADELNITVGYDG